MRKEKVSFRLSKDTIRDLEFLALKISKVGKRPSRTEALRYLIYKGFRSMPDWRRQLIINTSKASF